MSGSLDMDGGRLKLIKTASFGSVYANGDSGAAITIDWNNGQKQSVTITADCVFTFTAPPGPCSLQLVVTQGGAGGWVATWPATVLAPGGKAVSLVLSVGVGDIDVVSALWNGTNYLSMLAQDFLV